MNRHIKELQHFLNANGEELVEDGVFGEKTSAAIDGLDAQYWVKIGLKEVGTREVIGGGSNPRIDYYHKIAGLPWAKDQVPWCGSAMAYVFQKAIKDTPKNPARALSWSHFGIAIDNPAVGCVAVKRRDGGGHCGIVLAVRGAELLLLGGNQSDAFNIKKYRVSSFDWFRYPKGQSLNVYTLAFVDTSVSASEA
jgi:uncharacterized protein (TIGR02594 family)